MSRQVPLSFAQAAGRGQNGVDLLQGESLSQDSETDMAGKASSLGQLGKVVAITDGDTIKAMHASRPERVRLWGIDCPESHQAFGTWAKQSACRLAFGTEVKIGVRDTDRNGRAVGEVIPPDERNLNHELARAGLA